MGVGVGLGMGVGAQYKRECECGCGTGYGCSSTVRSGLVHTTSRSQNMFAYFIRGNIQLYASMCVCTKAVSGHVPLWHTLTHMHN